MPYKPLKKIYIDLLIIVAGFAVLGYLWSPYLYIICGLVALSALHPVTAEWISLGWEKVGKALGFVNSRILLTFFYFVIITPFSWVYKIMGSKAEKGWKKMDDQKPNFNNPW